jgi:hypothetical protein
MMKLRLTQGGFENYTGQMGVVWFENGLSTTDVLPIDGIRISAAIGATWEDGTAANVGDMYLNSMDVPAHVGMGTINTMSFEPVAPVPQQSETKAVASGETYTEESLAKIADEKGITGIREVADQFGVKGTSIVGLIAAIMKAQAKPQVE